MVYKTLGMSLQTNPKRHWIRCFLICVTVLIMCILISVNNKVQQVVLTNIQKNHTESTITLWNLPTHGHNEGQGIFLLPDKAEMEKMTDDQLMEIYWRYINTLQILCRNQIRLGYMKDGGKEVCVDEVYKPRKPCLVYSFGSAFQFDFEIDVIKKYRCEVHTFDPSVHIMGRYIPGGIHFHLIGLWSTSARNKKGWRMKTLSSIRDRLNHTNRIIDILKIDIEGAEWIALPEIFQSGVLKSDFDFIAGRSGGPLYLIRGEFHSTGLWDRPVTNGNGWRMETLSSIRKQLNHTNRVIDILKVDVDGAEWIALPRIFQSGVLEYVKQICIEVHVGKRKMSKSSELETHSKLAIRPEGHSTYDSLHKNTGPFLLPDDTDLNILEKEQLLEIYWKYINTLQVLCYNQRRIGSLKDGGKEICVDDLYKPRHPCLVYSFGSNFQFDFELDVIQNYNCEVHTFDPSKPISGRRIPKGIHFHFIGIWDRSMNNEKGWRMESLSSIRKHLHHTNRVIDVLKIDVEGAEWIALPEMFQSGVLKYVKQICMEVHIGKMKIFTSNWIDVAVQQLKLLRKLYEHGFYIFMREHNLFSLIKAKGPYPLITKVNEISLINTNFEETL